MNISYELTEEDYIHFNLFHIKNSRVGKRSLLLQRALSPFIFILFAFVYAKIAQLAFLPLFLTFAVISLLWIIFYPKYFYGLISRNAKKMIKEGKNDDLLGHHQLQLSEDGLIDTTAHKETKASWAGITSIQEDDGYFFLYNSSVSAYILPKRVLQDVEDVRQYLQSKILHHQ